MSEDEKERNPLFVPEVASKKPACPKCGDTENFSGRRIQGTVVFTCSRCGNKWHGGLPQEPRDPRVPYPADPSPPTVSYVQNVKSPTGVEEIRKRVDLRPDFRKGAPIKEDGEE